MEKITLYRYERSDGGVTVSPNKPEGAYDTLFRLVADEGMVLKDTDGNTAIVIDTDTPNIWTECEAPADELEGETDENTDI